MKLTDEVKAKAWAAFQHSNDWSRGDLYLALEKALETVIEGEVCDGEHGGPCPAWHDGFDGLKQRLEEADETLRSVRDWVVAHQSWWHLNKVAWDELEALLKIER